MSEISKGALTSENNNSFPNNNTGYITPTILRTFNQNMIDSLVDEISYTADSASFNSRINLVSGSIINTGSLVTTSSFNAYTSSNDSKVNAIIAATSSFITESETGSMTVLSASFAQTASFLLGSVASASYATLAETASYFSGSISNAISASYAITASRAREVVVVARNGNASTLGAGTVVRITSAVGDNPIFNTASWDDDSTSANTLGILQNSIASGADGDVVVIGTVLGVNTDPVLGYAAGQILYLSSSGQFTNVQPQAPNHIVTLGEVLRAQQNNGSIFVNISNGWELNELHNVAINGVANGDLLVYRSASGLWTNSSSIELGNATTGSNTFVGNQTITGSVRVDGDLILDDDGGTTQLLLNQKFTTEFLGSNLRWQEANKKVTWEVFESEVQLALAAYSASYDNGFIVDVKSDGTTLSDYNTSFVNQPWLKVPVNGNTNPPVQFPRGLGVTGSVNVSGSATFGGQSVFNGISIFNTPLTASAARVNGDIVATGNITATSASFQYVQTIFETASIIYSSGSNQLGDELSDVQTLSGSVKVQGELLVNGVPVQTSSFDASGYLLTSSFNSYTQSNDSKVDALISATASFITEAETSSFARTGSNTFIGNQNITGAIFQSSSTANEFTRIQIANSNKPFFGEANTLLSLVGDSQGIFDFYADGGNYDTLNIVINQNNGTTFRDWQGSSYNDWLKIPTNTGNNPAPQFQRGLVVTGSTSISGSTLTLNNGGGQALSIVSGSVAVTTPQGSGSFYTNLPITSSKLRINGDGIIADLYVSGVFAGNGTLNVAGNSYFTGSVNINNNVGITGSLDVNGQNIISILNGLIAETGSYAKTNTANNFVGDQKITGSVRVDGDFFLDDDGGTTAFLMNSKFNTEFLGSQWRWFESAKKFAWDVFEEVVDLNLAAYGTGYDNGLSINLRSDGTTFSDYNTSYVTQSWLRIPVNSNNNPAPQFPRGAGISGSLLVSGSTIVTGSVVGNVNSLSISSNTASLNLNNGNFFTLQLVSGSVTHINPTNIKAGQTINIRVNTIGSATVTFPSSVKQVSGSLYIPTPTTGVDILTLVTFDTSDVYLANVKNLI